MSTQPKEDFRQKLLSSGLDPLDVDDALFLFETIYAFDHAAFGGNGIPIDTFHSSNVDALVACYYASDPEGRECYRIFTQGLHYNLIKAPMYLAMRRISGRLENFPGGRTVKATSHQALVSIAAHEVRHRLNHEGLIKPFTPENFMRSPSVFVRVAGDYVQKYMMAKRTELERLQTDPKIIEAQCDNEEFDCDVIGSLVMHKMAWTGRREEAAKLMRAGPGTFV